MKRFNRLFALGVLLGAMPAHAEPQRILTVVTWGGAYEASQREAYFEPFTRETGIAVETVQYNGGTAALRDHLLSGRRPWHVIDMVIADAHSACAAGLLAPFDPAILAPAPDGTPPEEDFIAGAFTPCAVIQLVSATVLAYDDRAFPGIKPQTVEDFFDLERFPGKRALRDAPVGLLEWALLSYGVPRAQLYDLLSTERGLGLAFRRLDRIRDQLVWWEAGSEPPDLLEEGEVAMASGYNGRFFHAQVVEGAPISVIWDGQLVDFTTWAIPRNSPDRELAERFIRFATRTERMAAQANRISYGPARRSAQERIGLHVEAGVPMRPHMPTTENHLERAILQDHEWYARTEGLRHRRFEEWLAQGGERTASGETIGSSR
jgi:putative spermidine/putrescine transport system substrate-binding protein